MAFAVATDARVRKIAIARNNIVKMTRRPATFSFLQFYYISHVRRGGGRAIVFGKTHARVVTEFRIP